MGILVDVWGGDLFNTHMREEWFDDWPPALEFIQETIETGLMVNVIHSDFDLPPAKQVESMSAYIADIVNLTKGNKS